MEGIVEALAPPYERSACTAKILVNINKKNSGLNPVKMLRSWLKPKSQNSPIRYVDLTR